jgi:hypothetical protein
MNIENCPGGSATDQSFQSNITSLCDVSLTSYDAVTSTLLGIRGLSILALWYSWLRRRKTNLKKTDATVRKRWENRIPILASVNTVITITWFLMFLLVRFNLSSSCNGVTLLLWSVIFDGYAIQSWFFQRKIIRLGKKIIPMSIVKLERHTKNDSGFQSRLEKLQKLDANLMIIIFLEVILAIVQTVSGTVMGLIYPGEFVWIQLTFACEALCVLVLNAALIYQLERVITCIKTSTFDEIEKNKLARKFRSQQTHFAITTITIFIIMMQLVGGIFQATWYVMIPGCILETSTSSFAIIEIIGKVFLRMCGRSRVAMEWTDSPSRNDPMISSIRSKKIENPDVLVTMTAVS